MTRLRAVSASIAAIIVLGLLAVPAHAGQLDTIVESFSDGGSIWISRALPLGLSAFRVLAAFEVLLTIFSIAFLFLSDKIKPGGILAAALQKTIVIGFGLLALQFYPLFVPKLLQTFQDAGSQVVAIRGLTPSVVMGQGIYLCGLILFSEDRSGLFLLPAELMAAVSALLVLGCFTMLAWKFVEILVQSHLLLSGGMFFMGFLPSRVTVALAENYIVSLIRLGIQLYFLLFMVAVANTLVPLWSTQLATPLNGLDGLLPILRTAGEVLIFTLIAVRLPAKLAYELTAPQSFLHLRSALVGNA